MRVREACKEVWEDCTEYLCERQDPMECLWCRPVVVVKFLLGLSWANLGLEGLLELKAKEEEMEGIVKANEVAELGRSQVEGPFRAFRQNTGGAANEVDTISGVKIDPKPHGPHDVYKRWEIGDGWRLRLHRNGQVYLNWRCQGMEIDCQITECQLEFLKALAGAVAEEAE